MGGRLRERTLRSRIAVHTAGLCVAVLTLAGASIYFGVRQSLLWSLNNALLSITRTEIATVVDDPNGEIHLHEDYPAPLNLSAVDGYEKLAQVQDAQGTILGQTPNLRGKPPLPLAPPPGAGEVNTGIFFADLNRDGQPFRAVFYPLHDPLGNPMTAVVALSREPVDHALFMLLGTVGLAILIGGTAAGFGADRLARRLTRPLESMAAAARDVRDGNLSIRIPENTADAELRDLTRMLNEMLERLDASFGAQARVMAAQRRFLGDASHELRSPLGNIRGTIEVALRRPRLASQYREALNAAHSETMRMCRLVEDLLTLSRADAGQFAMEFSPCDLSYIARQAAMAHAGAASQADVALWVDASGAKMVNADRDRLRQVVDNLLDNAIRYAPGGSTVSIRTWAEGTRALLSVEDTGQGLTQEEQAHIFERFFRTDRARARHSGGLGLGLAIGAAILEAHDGRLTVESRPGEGATFTMALPAMLHEPQEDEQEPVAAGVAR